MRFPHRLIHPCLLPLALVLGVLAGCGGDESSHDAGGGTQLCSEGMCDGCCTDDGVCISGETNGACGRGGAACVACEDGAACEAGVCRAGCGPLTCSGCCDADGACVGGDRDEACGTGGAACDACDPPASCAGGRCELSLCAMTCEGCCTDGACAAGTADDACGAGGLTCEVCGDVEACLDGACALDPASPWTIVALDAVVPATKPNGASWDVGGGLPDPYLTVTVGGNAESAAQLWTSAESNTLEPAWNQDVLSGVTAAQILDRVSLWLRDQDGFVPDTIAECEPAVSEAIFDGDVVEVACGDDGALVRFRVEPSER